jgi:predicted CXXCH cytochrome family protein
MRHATAGIVLILSALVSPAATKDSCVSCHSTLDGKLAASAKLFDSDIHHQAGLSCADCHGGDSTDESMDAMSRARGFRSAPKKTQLPDFCARCHSDAAYMRRFNPKLRTDQLGQYWTSVHGKRLKQGDAKVAACVDCHGVHNILAVSDSRAPVYSTNVASTCAKCHADARIMEGYKIPTNQLARYQRSVHAQMLAQGDTSAPTCSTCHGNHGAAPPGVDSAANVCGTCHVFFAQLFDKSPHHAAFASMGLPGCVQCHSNHGIVRPADGWVGTGEKSVCVSCHSQGDKGYAAAQKIADDLASLRAASARADGVLNSAERSGMEVSSARLELADVNEALIKARVNVHSFNPEEVRKLTDQGVNTSKKAYAAGVAALQERDLRRKGLGVSLIFVALATSGLYFKIRKMESRSGP